MCEIVRKKSYSQLVINDVLTNSHNQGRLHKKRAGGEISQKGTKDTILTSYPRKDLRDDH